jgi:hypothetical protein
MEPIGMTLFHSSPQSSVCSRRYRFLLAATFLAWIAVTALLFFFDDHPAEERVNRFFAAIESQNFPEAYGIWNNDPGWWQHPSKYVSEGYPYSRFLEDWGPSGDYGVIHSHKILYSRSKRGNTVLMAVEINGHKAQPTVLAVGRKDHTIGFSPFELTPQKDLFGFTYWQISYR